jgi:hypothetical protein
MVLRVGQHDRRMSYHRRPDAVLRGAVPIWGLTDQ